MLSHVFILDVINPARPVYRLAGTGLCERFGMELKGTGFLAHWEGQSGLALNSLLKQALKARQPVCLSSIGATADCGMVELETILAPISFNGDEPVRFVGLTQVLSDMALLAGRPIAFQRLCRPRNSYARTSRFSRHDAAAAGTDAAQPWPSQSAAPAPGRLAGA